MTKPIILKGSAIYLELNGGLRDLDYIMLNLPFSCNYDCVKCCNAERTSYNIESKLSFNEISAIIDESKNLGVRVLVMAGEGEPIISKDFREIINKANNSGLIPYIFTNGSQLDKDTVHFLKDGNATIIVNMDSLVEERYEALTKGNFSNIMRNIAYLRESFRDNIDHTEKYDISRIAINTVVSPHNVFEMFPEGDEPMRKFCGSDFALVYNLPIFIGNATQSDFQIREGILKKIQTRTSKNIPLGTTSDGLWCAYMTNGISIGKSGEILTCAYSLESAGSIENIRARGLAYYIGKAKKDTTNFYKTEGYSRCILRHPKYTQFIEQLKK